MKRARTCTYLGCDAVATVRLWPSNSRVPWFGCEAHWPTMADALAVGVGSTGSVDITRRPGS